MMFNKIVLWGYAGDNSADMAHIWNHFYDAAVLLGIPVVWVGDEEASRASVERNDIVLAVDVASQYVPLWRDDVWFVTHNIDDGTKPYEMFPEPTKHLRLQVYTDACLQNNVDRWMPASYFDKGNRTLYQPWGTDIFYEDFLEPIQGTTRVVNFVGSVWDNELGQGNLRAVDKLIPKLRSVGLDWVVHRNVSDDENRRLVRESYIAPAIAGEWQVANNYLPCRVFKNVSYGQLAITNVPKFQEIFEGCSLQSLEIDALIDEALSITTNDYYEMVKAQQDCIGNQSYRAKYANILRALEEIGGA